MASARDTIGAPSLESRTPRSGAIPNGYRISLGALGWQRRERNRQEEADTKEDFQATSFKYCEYYRTTITVMELDLTLPSPRLCVGGMYRAADMVYLPGWLKS